jgi:hypothetical protein
MRPFIKSMTLRVSSAVSNTTVLATDSARPQAAAMVVIRLMLLGATKVSVEH